MTPDTDKPGKTPTWEDQTGEGQARHLAAWAGRAATTSALNAVDDTRAQSSPKPTTNRTGQAHKNATNKTTKDIQHVATSMTIDTQTH